MSSWRSRVRRPTGPTFLRDVQVQTHVQSQCPNYMSLKKICYSFLYTLVLGHISWTLFQIRKEFNSGEVKGFYKLVILNSNQTDNSQNFYKISPFQLIFFIHSQVNTYGDNLSCLVFSRSQKVEGLYNIK